MWKILRRWRVWLPLGLAACLALILLKTPARYRRGAEREAGGASALLLEQPAKTARKLRQGASHLRELWGAENRARRLEEELSLLRLEYRQLEESYQRALTRSRSLQAGRRWLTRLIPANLLARDPGTWFHVVLLDRGKDDGVEAGAGVVSPLGVVGKVISVQPQSCKVVFVTDASCRVSVRLARSRVLAILAGDGRRGCRLEYLSGQEDVKVGDFVETAPGSLHFPSGIPAGTVTRVQKIDNGLRLAVDLQPAADLNRLEGLYIAGRSQE